MNLRKDHYRRFLLSFLEERYKSFSHFRDKLLLRDKEKGNISAVIAAPDGHSFDAPCVLSRLPISGPPIYPREWEASRLSPSGRSAVWRRAAWPGTLGRPGVQVAKGSSIPISSPYGRGGLIRAFESVSVGGRLPGRLALTSPAPRMGPRPPGFIPLFSFFSSFPLLSREGFLRHPSSHRASTKTKKITADGGSLGSRVDEERSQLRESM